MIVITNCVLIYIMRRTNMPPMRFVEAPFRELTMPSQSTTHFPADSIRRGDGGSVSSDQPVVLIAFAKLVVMTGILVIFTPAWLELMAQLAYGPPPQAWGAFRVVALLGSIGFLALAAMILRVWTGLLKHLARAD
jgi:hypothetical protein